MAEKAWPGKATQSKAKQITANLYKESPSSARKCRCRAKERMQFEARQSTAGVGKAKQSREGKAKQIGRASCRERVYVLV